MTTLLPKKKRILRNSFFLDFFSPILQTFLKVFLDEVKKAYPKAKKIKIFLDNARYQRNYEVIDYAKKLNITLEFMPPYSPNLCLIERLWKFFKKKVIKNTYYESFDDFFQFVSQFFSKKNWSKIRPELQSLLTLKFEII